MSMVGTGVQRLLTMNERRLDAVAPKPDGPLDTDDHPWMRELESHTSEIVAEVDALIAQGVLLPQVSDLAGFDQGNEGSWSNLVLFSYGAWVEANTGRCPRTTELVRDIPGLQIAGYSVLGPGARLPPHRGPNRGALRYQIGLRVPGPPGSCGIRVGEVVHTWADGASMVFDHSVEHEAWNRSTGDRYVLFIEFVWPVSGLTGVLNRVTQRTFGLAARRLPQRAEEADRALNPTDEVA